MGSNGTTTAYDAAIAAATTQVEKDRLRDLRLRFNAPPDSPEWQFYAVMAPLIAAQQQQKKPAKQVESDSAALRYALVFAASILVTVAISMVSLPSTPFALAAAFVLGVAATLAYLYLAPIVANAFRR